MLLGALFYWLDPSINTFGTGLWLAFVTGSTVGYGDVVPTTGATRLLAVLTVLVGVAMMTLFTANVVAFFVGGEESRLREALLRDIEALRGDLAQLRAGGELARTSELEQEVHALRQELAALRGELRETARPVDEV
jgi:voltage-gated potassium channel